MKKTFCITTLFLLLCSTSFGQVFDEQARSGSVYSNIGVGIPIDLTSSSAAGIGVPGVSFHDSNVPGLANPAHWGNSFFTLATGGVSLTKFNASDNLSRSENALLNVNSFQLLLPIKKNKFGISLSMVPRTNSNFRIVNEDTRIIGSGSSRDTLVANTENRGDGGVNSLEMGFGWRINKNISFGYAGSLVFLSLDNEITSQFTNSSFQDINFEIETSGVGFGNRFGTYLTFSELFDEEDQLNIGATVNFPININSERIRESNKLTGPNSVETVVLKEGSGLGDGDVTLPFETSFGITYKPNSLLSIVAEGIYGKWSDFEYDFNTTHEKLMENRYKIGAGIRYFPFLLESDKFFSKFKYRLGVSYDTGHLDIKGEQIETLLFAAGIGILSPQRNANSSIDINVQYGLRGTRKQGLVKENFWGIKLSINLAELMFFRPKLQ